MATLHGRRHGPLAAPRDHADLERQQLVEGEPPQGGVAPLEVVGEVGLLERLGDRRPGRSAARRSPGRYSGYGPIAVEGGPDGGPQRPQGEAGRERVDRDDPADVQQVAVRRLEGRVVEQEPERRAA